MMNWLASRNGYPHGRVSNGANVMAAIFAFDFCSQLSRTGPPCCRSESGEGGVSGRDVEDDLQLGDLATLPECRTSSRCDSTTLLKCSRSS
jgi:hypothetical protein